MDFTPPNGSTIRGATSFAVHKQLVKVTALELEKTSYTGGDSVSLRIVVKNLSDQPVGDIQVEFEPYTYPWIAAEPDEPANWKFIVAQSLRFAPGEEERERERERERESSSKATTAQVEKNQPEALYYPGALVSPVPRRQSPVGWDQEIPRSATD